MPKKLFIGASVAIDLKAEIENAKNKSLEKKKDPKPSVKRNRGVDERNRLDIQYSALKIPKTTSASKQQLEKKSKIYEQLVNSSLPNPSQDKEIAALLAESSIDFETKKLEALLENYDSSTSEEFEEPDPWVEYDDEFGRSRMARKSEIETMKSDSLKESNELLSKDMQVELERRNWEAEALSEITNSSSHYDDKLDLRNKGVGFYRFSQDEETRKRQQENLDKLRAEVF
ncbi:Coiled-coil domain-containing protein 174 [Smittium mucronatum]|uniref:Coiled-coil domain-containing protein 174 n=1 Tax=Smittium mucronatum TaxID=133383 RepID=A0A1R0GPE3_9FUNG|nr:Coiled-coil domain-containing protein 174 [Smittium mucronatum]